MDLHGWDIVTAVDIATVNNVLAKSTSTLMPTFNFENSAMSISFAGDFGLWLIQPGGSANRIKMMVPITSGSLSAPQFPQPIDLTGVQPIIDMALDIVEANAASQSVVFSLKTNSPTPNDQDGTIYVANPDASGLLATRDPSGQAASIISQWLGEVFVTNAGKISFVFATVILDPQGMPWLAPKATSLSYFESTDGKTQALGIQSLTQASWDASGLATAIDPSLLNGQSGYFFAMAPAVFLKNLLLPNVAGALKIAPSALQFNPPPSPAQPESCSITNTGPISMGSVRSGAIDYYPQLNSYSVQIVGSQIITNASGQFDITGLHDAYVTFDNLSIVMEVGYDSATKSATFNVVSKSSPSTDEHIPWYEKEITWIIPVIGLIVNTVMDIVVSVVEDAVTSAVSSSGQLSIDAIPVATAVWTGLNSFSATNVQLSSAFIIEASS